MQALDTDGDGEISAAEIAVAADSLAALDANGDGAVSVDEVITRPVPGMVRRAFAGGFAASRGFAAGRRSAPGRGAFAGRRGDRRFVGFGRGGFAGGGLWTSRPGMRGGRHWFGGFQAGRFHGGRGRPADGEFRRGPESAEHGDWQQAREAMRERMLDGLFSRFDTDGVGYLDADDLPEMLRERLSGADADGNGQLTRLEIEAHQQSMGGRGRGRFGPQDEQQPEGSPNQ